MIEIRYDEHYEEVDLAGKSVAEVREMYKSEFSLPDRAQANLNGEPVRKELEATTFLNDDDILSFEVESRKRGPVAILGAFLLALAITGGLFAYTTTTDTTTITVTAVGADFADVSANSSVVYNTENITGKTVGKINGGVMFDVLKDSNYTGDLEIIVSLANADELVQEYSAWMLRLKFTDGTADGGVDVDDSIRVISLKKPTVIFSVDSANLSVTRYIYCQGGMYKTLSSSIWAGQAYDPLIFAQVAQAGAH